MSVEEFVRKPDGTAWKGRISYNYSAKRENDFKLKFEENKIPLIDTIYQSYGVSSALRIDPSQLSNMGNLALVYRFLYGYNLDELMKVDESKSVGYYASWINEPHQWSKPMVLSMDWDLFCLSYYTLLCTNNSFKSKVWQALLDILQILKQDRKLLPAILLQCDRTYDDVACEEFWETIYNGLSSKVLGWLREQTCYVAYEALSQICNILPDDRYQAIEGKCCAFWSDIARKRINEETTKAHTIKELVNFDGELAFFYKEYFALASTDESTKQYIFNTTCTFLCTIGDKIFASGDALGADLVYEAALKFAQTNDDSNTIMRKRNSISPYVATAKATKEKEQRKEDSKRKKARRSQRIGEVAARVILIAVALSILLIVVFGIFALLGMFEALAKTVLKIAFAVVIAFAVFMAIMHALDKK